MNESKLKIALIRCHYFSDCLNPRNGVLNFRARSCVALPRRPASLATMQFLVGLLLAGGVYFGQQPQPVTDLPALDTVMAQVATNQDRGEAARKQFRCIQHIHIATSKPGFGVMREETADYEFAPGATETALQFHRLTGRYWNQGKYEDFNGEPVPAAKSWDADYIRDVRMCLTNEKSRCASTPPLFPLTSEEQKQYDFRFIGRETLRERDVYHVAFTPKNKSMLAWAGEAYIDATDLQPVRVFTNLSRRVPFAVRTVLGTDISGFGYNIEYKRREDGKWLPTSYGTEYELRLFFHINRTVSVSMDTLFQNLEKNSTN